MESFADMVRKVTKAQDEEDRRRLTDLLAAHAPPCPEWFQGQLRCSRDDAVRLERLTAWPWHYAAAVMASRPDPAATALPPASSVKPPPPTYRAQAMTDDAPAAPGRPISISPGAVLVSAERVRQIEVKGYTADADAGYTSGQFIDAALAYLTVVARRADASDPDDRDGCPGFGDGLTAIEAGRALWPIDWRPESFKPSDDDVRNLVRSAALIVAELDRRSAAGTVLSFSADGPAGDPPAILPPDNG